MSGRRHSVWARLRDKPNTASRISSRTLGLSEVPSVVPPESSNRTGWRTRKTERSKRRTRLDTQERRSSSRSADRARDQTCCLLTGINTEQGKREVGPIKSKLPKPRRRKGKFLASGKIPPGRTIRKLEKGSHVIESQHSLRFVSDGALSVTSCRQTIYK